MCEKPCLFGQINYLLSLYPDIIIYFRRNILGYTDDDELRNCRFTKDHPHYQFCPIFVLRDIVSYAGVTDFDELAAKVLDSVMQAGL